MAGTPSGRNDRRLRGRILVVQILSIASGGAVPDVEENRGLTIEGLPLSRLRDLAEVVAMVGAAATVGLFEALHPGTDDADAANDAAPPTELARRLGLDPRGVSIVLAALADVDLLTRDEEGRYGLTEQARRHLGDRDAPDYEAGGLPLWLENLRAFASLPTVLEQGGPLDEAHRAEGGGGGSDASGGRMGDEPRRGGEAPDGSDEPDEGLAHFMAAMASAPRSRIERLADRCLERLEPSDDRPLRLLDLGGGPGHMSRVFAERGVHAVLFDRPATVDYVGDAYDLADEPSIGLVGGDFLEEPLPEGPFDIALLSNVVHIYGPETNRRLLARVAERVRPGGVVAVADFVRGRSPRAARFALVMLLHTEEGDTYTEEEVRRWLREAGFRDPRCSDLDDDRQVITALRVPAGT